MRQSFIFLVLSLMFGVIGWYMISQVINPLNEAKVNEIVSYHGYTKPEEVYDQINSLTALGVIKDYIDLRQIILVTAVVILSIDCMFLAIHTFLDKLFFKEFYRGPNLRIAMRRTILLTLALGGAVAIRILGLNIWSTLSPLLLAFVLELLFISIGRARRPKTSQVSQTESGQPLADDIIDPPASTEINSELETTDDK